jgi:hypothetical protein
MLLYTDGPVLSDWLKHSTNPKEITNISVPILPGVALGSGTVLGKITASGLYTKHDTAANDGTETAMGILCNPVSGTATTATGHTGATTTLVNYTAAQPGAAGNSISIALVDPGVNNGALSVEAVGSALSGYAITVSLATDNGGVITTTSGDLTTPFAALVADDTGRKIAYAADGGNDTAPLTEATVTLSGGTESEMDCTGVMLKLGAGILVAGSKLIFSGSAATVKAALESAGVVYASEVAGGGA